MDSVLDPNLIGKYTMNPESLWQEMSRTRGAVYSAMAGLDIALWDIRGKAWGLPIYQLLEERVLGSAGWPRFGRRSGRSSL